MGTDIGKVFGHSRTAKSTFQYYSVIPCEFKFFISEVVLLQIITVFVSYCYVYVLVALPTIFGLNDYSSLGERR